MASRPSPRDSIAALRPVVGFGLTVAITLLAAMAVGVLTVLFVG